MTVPSYPLGSGGGADNLQTVDDIAARDLLTPNSDELVYVVDASADPEVSSGSAWYQYNDTLEDYVRSSFVTATETTPGVLAIASSAEAVSGSASNKIMTPERVAEHVAQKVIAYNATSAADLETNNPASANSGRFAFVQSGDATEGIYYSNGTSWLKIMDDCGDRTTLFNYGSSISFTGLDDLGAASGTIKWTESNGSTDITSFIGSLSNIFDDNYNSILYKTGVDLSTTVIWKELDSAESYGKFTIDFYNTATASIEDFYLVGWNGTAFVRLNITSISTNGTATRSGNLITGVDPSISETVTVTTDNLTDYTGFGIEIASTSTVGSGLRELSGEISSTVDTESDVVSSINALSKGVLLDDNPETSSTVNLEVSSKCIQHADTSLNSVTYVLPGVGENGARGKVFVFKVDEASNSLIIDGDGSETIEGSTTQTLNTVGEVMAIQCNGSSWDLLWHYNPVAAAVDSVNGNTGAVVLDADDLSDGTTNKMMTAAERTKLTSIESDAKDDQTGAEIEALLDSELGNTDWKTGTVNKTKGQDSSIPTVTGSAASLAIQAGKLLRIDCFWNAASGSTRWSTVTIDASDDTFQGIGGNTAGTSVSGTLSGSDQVVSPDDGSSGLQMRKNGSNYEYWEDSGLSSPVIQYCWF